jgi:DNA-binding transcriptional regulator YiaG
VLDLLAEGSDGADNHVGVVEVLDLHANNVVLPERFMLLRRRMGVTQAQLSRDCGVWQSHISAWERGRRSLPGWAVYALYRRMVEIARERGMLSEAA